VTMGGFRRTDEASRSDPLQHLTADMHLQSVASMHNARIWNCTCARHARKHLRRTARRAMARLRLKPRLV